MLSDQNEMVFDLRGKLSEAEKEIADLRSAHHDMESFLESSKEEAHKMLDKLTRKAEKERQHKATIEGLEVSNSRLRQELELYRDDDSTCSSSSTSSSSSKSNSDSSHSSISGDDSCIVLGSRGEGGEHGEGRSDTGDAEFSRSNSQHRHTHKHRDRDQDCRSPQTKLIPQDVLDLRKAPLKGITPGLGPSSSEGGLEMQVRSQDSIDLNLAALKKQLRVTSRRELKGWVLSLTKGLIETQLKIPSDLEVEENEKAKRQYTTQVQGLEAELLSCSQAAKEFKKGREEAESLLMRKEKEGLRAAQSMVGTSPPLSSHDPSPLLS
jgi:translation initiation factor 1 (eIF-1/SUI1)